jgi:hypothetical protein
MDDKRILTKLSELDMQSTKQKMVIKLLKDLIREKRLP